MGHAPRAPCQSGARTPDRHTCPGGRCQGIEALDEGGLDAAGQTARAQGLTILIGCAEIDVRADFSHAPAATRTCGGAGVPFDDLGLQQSSVDRPTASALAHPLNPLSEMGRERIEIESQAIA